MTSVVGGFTYKEKTIMKINNLLPIGSVVLLKDGEKRLMICGILQNDEGNTNKTYDYMGVLYPEGHIGEGYQYLFNHEDVVQVFFRGYDDEERAQFIEKLAVAYEQ